MNKAKLQVISAGVFFALSLLMLLGTTVAYFSDTKQATSTITVGNVAIELTEAAVKRDGVGNLVEDTSVPRIKGGKDTTLRDYGVIYPGISIYKDPTIKNVGSSEAWIAAKITVTDGDGQIDRIIGYDGEAGIDIGMLLSGALLSERCHFGTWNGIPDVRYNDKYAIVQKSDALVGEYTFYVFFSNTFAPGAQETLFDHFSIPDDWSNEMMQEFRELTIHIQAFGVQVFDLDSCYEAMTKAFATHFS
ncbi:MAG: hypothetical protein E7461_00970 [Ruminococcaceae bacterium]|nr:hypothetical protein [Oscillospiraceae bacterium]